MTKLLLQVKDDWYLQDDKSLFIGTVKTLKLIVENYVFRLLQMLKRPKHLKT